jgi:hypothetical protein
MRVSLFCLLALFEASAAYAGYHVRERRFTGGGRNDFKSVASDTSQAMVELGQAVLNDSPTSIDIALKHGGDARGKFYVRYRVPFCIITGQYEESEGSIYGGECYTDAITLATYLDHPQAALKLIDLGFAQAETVLATAAKGDKPLIALALTRRGLLSPNLLVDAVHHNDTELARMAIKNGANPFVSAVQLTTDAALAQNYELFVELVDAAEGYAKSHGLAWDKKKYLDTPNPDLASLWVGKPDRTPLGIAVHSQYRSVELVKYLVQSGASVSNELLDAATGAPTFKCQGTYNQEIYDYLYGLGLRCVK